MQKTFWDIWSNRVLVIIAVAAVLGILYAGGWLAEWAVGMLR